MEELLTDSGLSYAVIRPTLVFGEGDLLLNNMAWALRRFPVVPVIGNWDYQIQPIYAEVLAAKVVDGGSLTAYFVSHAVRTETFSFKELFRLLASAVTFDGKGQ